MGGGRRFGALQMNDYIIRSSVMIHHNYMLKKLLDVWSMAGHSGDYTLNVPTTIIIIVYTAKLQQPPPRLPIFVVFDVESRSFLSPG